MWTIEESCLEDGMLQWLQWLRRPSGFMNKHMKFSKSGWMKKNKVNKIGKQRHLLLLVLLVQCTF